MEAYKQAVKALPGYLAEPLGAVRPETAGRVHEVRLRVGCPVWLNIGGALCPAQQLPGCPSGLQNLRPAQAQMWRKFSIRSAAVRFIPIKMNWRRAI